MSKQLLSPRLLFEFSFLLDGSLNLLQLLTDQSLEINDPDDSEPPDETLKMENNLLIAAESRCSTAWLIASRPRRKVWSLTLEQQSQLRRFWTLVVLILIRCSERFYR